MSNADPTRANDFLRALLDNLEEGIVACDASGVLTLFNRATRKFHGLPQEPLPAERWAEHYDLYCADGITPMATDQIPLFVALRGEPVKDMAMVIAPKAGRRRWLVANGRAFHDGDGQLLGAVVSMHDFTRRRDAEIELQHAHDSMEARVAERTAELTRVNQQLLAQIAAREASEAQLRQEQARKNAMFEAALDCIISIDHNDRIIEFNAAAERTLGHARAAVLGRGLAEVLIPERFRARHLAGMQRYLASGHAPVLDQRLELSALRADGSEFPVELTVTRVPVAGPPTFTAYLRDLSEQKQAQSALLLAETRWRRIFEGLHEGFLLGEIIYDEGGNAVDWRYLEINRAWEAMTGLSSEGVQGRLLSEVIPGAEPEWVRDFNQVVVSGIPATFLREVAPLGRIFEVHAYRPEPGRFAALFLDVTVRQRAETKIRESEERLRFVLDSMPQKIFTATADGSLDYCNPQWTEYTGLSFDQFKDWGWLQFVHPDDQAGNVRIWKQALASGEPFEFEQRFRHHDGSYRWHISRALALRDENLQTRMWVGSNTDIEGQKQASESLRELASALAEADRRKTEFLAMLAHELRNPLAPLSNAIQILRRAGGGTETIDPLVAMMQRQVTQIIGLVDDLLDLSRITLGRISFRPQRVEVATIIDQAVEASQPLLDAAAHQFSKSMPAAPVMLMADPLRLVQVIGNLINNACKFTAPGGRIELRATREGSEVVIAIRDNGIGIAPERLGSIFDMFVQIDQSIGRTHGGLGIGLTLVRHLVALHGGSISAASAGLGTGSEFVVRLPLDEGPGSLAPIQNLR